MFLTGPRAKDSLCLSVLSILAVLHLCLFASLPEPHWRSTRIHKTLPALPLFRTEHWSPIACLFPLWILVCKFVFQFQVPHIFKSSYPWITSSELLFDTPINESIAPITAVMIDESTADPIADRPYIQCKRSTQCSQCVVVLIHSFVRWLSHSWKAIKRKEYEIKLISKTIKVMNDHNIDLSSLSAILRHFVGSHSTHEWPKQLAIAIISREWQWSWE